jgi:transcriptional regulator with GAF, ATPase, and Fis domain
MSHFTVTVPYSEKELGKEAKNRKLDFSVDAETSVAAVQMAIGEFRTLSTNDYTAWNIRVDEAGITVCEMTSGDMFRVSETSRKPDRAKEEQKMLSMEEYLRQVSIDPKERMLAYEEALRIVSEPGTTGEICGAILRLAIKTLKVEAGAVLLRDFAKGDLYFAAAEGPKAKEVVTYRVAMGQGLAGYAAESAQAIAVSDVKKDPRFFRKIADDLKYDTRSILAVPIRFGAETLGVLELINQLPDDHFDGNDIELTRNLAQYLASAVRRDG